MKKIMLDFDSVVADSVKSMTEYYSYNYSQLVHPHEVRYWDAHESMPLLKDGECEKIFESDVFWESLTLSDDFVKSFIEKYRDRIVIVTVGTHLNIRKKIKWIQDNLGDINMLPIIKESVGGVKMDKSIVNMKDGIHIDDNVNNLYSTNAKHKICFALYGMDKEWNKDWNGFIAESFDELDRLIEILDKI